MVSGPRTIRTLWTGFSRRQAVLVVLFVMLAVTAWWLDLPHQWRRYRAAGLVDSYQPRAALSTLGYASDRPLRSYGEGILVVRALMQLNRTSEARARLRELAASNKESPLVLLLEDAVAAQTGDRSALERLTAAAPDTVPPPEVYEAILRCAEYHGQWDLAHVVLEQLKGDARFTPIVWYHRGRITELQEDVPEAAKAYREAARAAPAMARAWFRLGKSLYAKQDFQAAFNAFQALLSSEYVTVASIEMANCLWELGKPGEAISIVKSCFEADPHEIVVNYLELDEFCDQDRVALVAARCHDLLGDSESAVAWARRVLDFNHRNFEARSLLIKHLQRLGRSEEAEAVAALQQRMLQNRRRCDELRDLIAANPNDPELRLELAKLYWATESESEARLVLRELLEMHPDYQPAHALMRHWDTIKAGNTDGS